MSRVSAASVVEKHLTAFNTRQEADEPWADEAELVAPGVSLVGRDGVLAFLRVFQTAFPDGQLVAVASLEAGDRAAVEGRFEGTHTGPLVTPAGEVPATGRRISFRWAALYQVDGTRLMSEHLFFDQADFAAQLGLG